MDFFNHAFNFPPTILKLREKIKRLNTFSRYKYSHIGSLNPAMRPRVGWVVQSQISQFAHPTKKGDYWPFINLEF